MIVSFLVPAIIYGVAFASDFRILKRDVERHEILLLKINETLELALRNQSTVAQRLADHLDYERGNPATRTPKTP